MSYKDILKNLKVTWTFTGAILILLILNNYIFSGEFPTFNTVILFAIPLLITYSLVKGIKSLSFSFLYPVVILTAIMIYILLSPNIQFDF